MTTIIGVDPSFSCTGVAVWVDGKAHTFSVVTKSGTPRVYREMQIVDAVMEWVGPDTIAAGIEGVYFNRFGGRVSLDLAGLHDVLIYEFIRKGISVAVPNNRSNKKFATQNGAATKKDMVAAAKALLGISVKKHDEADALWLAMMVVVSMGGQLNNWPPDDNHHGSRLDSIAHMTWNGTQPGMKLGTGD